ncbi:PIG-L deacetylase family protein [Halopelagius longus]|uniref:N-acetylglucosaminyl deacetylase, LmbE family n=1 Tax=Halopelagius longus TaxID=1236180 RepID=A0A1H1GVI9_9EURY|nr:PIG-L deacetylase family protein [Halopelagius longus]RDI69534.1 hypothetical protein DWB78_18435 [Halopelagius longus]SDR17232.1 N-acetylglucosaminyl deacetylase, LmbE family [Halopelagius longus]
MIVAVGSHPDDIQLGCGATLRHLALLGYHIEAVVVTNGEQTSLAKEDKITKQPSKIGEQRQRETKAGFDHLGIDKITFLGLPDLGVSASELVGQLPVFDEHIDLIFTHTSNDAHPDHRATADAVGRRYDESKILHMESPSTVSLPNPLLLVDVSDTYHKKIDALQQHRSQWHKRYMKPDSIREKMFYEETSPELEFAERFGLEASECEQLEGLIDTKTIGETAVLGKTR